MITELANDYQALLDIITTIKDETLLTPATVNRILVESGRCGDFLNNPETFQRTGRWGSVGDCHQAGQSGESGCK